MRLTAHLRRWWVGRLVDGQMGRHNVWRVIKGHHGRRKSGRKCLNAHRQRDGHLHTAVIALLMSVLHLIALHRTAVGDNVGAEASILAGAMTTSIFLGSRTAKSTGHLKRDSFYNVHDAGI